MWQAVSVRPKARRSTYGLTSNRVEAFSDGVFAIAATLLILDVRVPASPPGGLWSGLVSIWPQYAAYAASFLVIGIMWLNHHALFSRLARVDRPLVILNLFLLMVIAFVPFPTQVLGSHINQGDARAAALFYALTAILIAIGFSAIYTYATLTPGLLSSRFSPEDMMRATPWFTIGLASYLVCIPVAFISPTAVVVLVGATALYYAFDRLPGPRVETAEREAP